MADEYIKREPVLKYLADIRYSVAPQMWDAPEDWPLKKAEYSGLSTAIEVIEEQPIEYVEPVLRCKECQHRTTTGLCRVWDTKMAEDEYCSRAEPKRDEWDKQAELGILPPGGTISAEYADREPK